MSYILDALNKATAEREQQRGGSPDLQSQPMRAARSNRLRLPLPLSRWHQSAFYVLAMTVATAAGLVWYLMRDDRRAENAPPLPRVALAAPAATPPTLQGSPSSLASPAPMPMPMPTPPLVTMPPPLALPTAKPRGTLAPVVAATTQPAQVTVPAGSPAAVNRPIPAAAAAAYVPSPSPAPVALPALPTGAPKLVVTGSTFADNPAYRMLIINGQVFREGDNIGSDMRLDQIRRGAAVVNFQGTAYSLTY